MQTMQCGIGFEDGQVSRYRVEMQALSLEYQFWNDKRGTLAFGDVVAVQDSGAVGVIIGKATERDLSEFGRCALGRHYAVTPQDRTWLSFCFFDLDDNVVLDIVATSCNFEFIP